MSQKDIYLESEGDAWFNRNIQLMEDREYYPDIEFLTPYIAPPNERDFRKIRCLDIGCSSGHRTNDLAKKTRSHVFGLDPSAKAIRYANRTFGFNNSDNYALNFQVGTADDLTFRDSYFDFVYFSFCLYTIDRDSLSKIVIESNRVLRKHGKLGILDFDSSIESHNTNQHNESLRSFRYPYENLFTALGYELIAKLSLKEDGNLGFEEDKDKRVSVKLLYKP